MPVWMALGNDAVAEQSQAHPMSVRTESIGKLDGNRQSG